MHQYYEEEQYKCDPEGFILVSQGDCCIIYNEATTKTNYKFNMTIEKEKHRYKGILRSKSVSVSQ